MLQLVPTEGKIKSADARDRFTMESKINIDRLVTQNKPNYQNNIKIHNAITTINKQSTNLPKMEKCTSINEDENDPLNFEENEKLEALFLAYPANNLPQM